MTKGYRSPHRIIWAFGLGYLIAYAPYAALTKLVTSGHAGGVAGLSGFELLPATIAGTLFTLPLILASLGWWKYAAIPNRHVVASGLGTALIIGTTTLAYTFEGISVVLALLLMRGGVLVMAPLVDAAFRRHVRWFSWAALALSFGAVAIALTTADRRDLTFALAAVLAVYLAGYSVRLACMTRAAKVRDDDATRRYLVGESMVALIALPAITLILAAIGRGPFMLDLRRGWLGMLELPALVPALTIGALYAVLFVFGTLIYLDRRENTFCIPLNRSSSLLAGIVAGGVLHTFYGFPPVPATQIAAAAAIALALLLLSPAHHALEIARDRRVLLFICSGNTCRSPMAEAVANAELATRFGDRAPVQAISAGLAAKRGAPMSEPSRAALRLLEVEPHDHAARPITPDVVDAASFIYCMTRGQRDAMIRSAPSAAVKTLCLDPEGDVDDPSGHPIDVYAETARRIQRLVRLRFDQAGLRA